MLPEFEIKSKYDKAAFARDLVSTLTKGKDLSQEQIDKYEERVLDSIESGKFAIKDSSEYNIWKTYQREKENYKITGEDKLEKVKYDFNKSPKENGLKARNNVLIDMMWGILTNPDTAEKMLNPGGFDEQKSAAKILTILKSVSEEELKKILGANDKRHIITILSVMDLDTLKKLASQYKEKLDPLSPVTQVVLHQRNMTGANLIGIYANHNANHALMQHTMLALDEKNGLFRLNGRTETSLHQIKSKAGRFISKLNAGFLAASVDNAKDPVLGDLNQNSFTADLTMLLSRLSYEPLEIGLFLNQPIVKDITQAYFRLKREGKSKNAIIDDIIEEYRNKAGMMESVTYDNYKTNKFGIDELADNILLEKEMDDIENANQTSDYRKIAFYRKQVAVGYLFKRVMTSGDALGQLVQATRSDTQRGAAGPSIADTQIKLMKVQDFIEKVVNNPNSPLIGADVLINDLDIENMNETELRKALLESPLPFLQAFYTLGLQASSNMLSDYFPQYKESFIKVVNTLRKMTKLEKLDAKTINNIYNDLLAYIMSRTEFFGQEGIISTDGVINVRSSSDKRRDFINTFPEYFLNAVKNNPEIAELGFIKRLKVIKAGKHNPVDTIVFKNVGQLSPNLREEFMRDWQSLLYMGPEAQQLALNLFRYSYYRNGFAFGPNSFIHLAPVAIRQAIPEYVETLRKLVEEEDDYSQFIDQYVYNHLDNRKLVPEISEEANIQFLDDSREPLQIVSVHVDEYQSYATKGVVKSQEEIDGIMSYEFFQYIARKHKDGFIYYRLVESNGQNATYMRIEPLGYKNSFIEYEYGKDATEMKSVIQKKSMGGNLDLDDIQAFNDDTEYDNLPDYVNQDYSAAFETTIQQDAFQTVYDSRLEENFGDIDNFDTLEPNNEFRDANNDKICD